MGSEPRLSGKDHRLNNIEVGTRDELAIRIVMAWHTRELSSFPKQVTHNWSFGWTLFVLWSYRCRLVKAGAEVTEIALFEMLHNIVDDSLLPFGVMPQTQQLDLGLEEPEEEIEPVNGDDLGIFSQDGKPMVGSRTVAAAFEKRHNNVLQDIKKLDCSKDFHALNFQQMIEEVTVGKGAKRNSPVVHMTRDGFTFLAMGYTGKRAAQYKEAYINRFNEMEAEFRELRAQETPALPSPTGQPKRKRGKTFYLPEEAAEELGLSGYRVLYKRMEALGLVMHEHKRYLPAPQGEKLVRMRTFRTKMNHRYQRPVITLAGMDYLREKLAA